MRLLPIVLTLLSPAVGAAQDTLPPPAGALVRVAGAQKRAVVGALESIGPDTIRITTAEGQRLAFARADVRRFDRSAGRSAGAGAMKGVKLGTGIGAGASLVFVGLMFASGDATSGGSDQAASIALLVGASVVSGATYGAVIGAIVKAQRWTTVPLGGDARLSVRPMGSRRLGVLASYSF